jgi:hypothetical protein
MAAKGIFVQGKNISLRDQDKTLFTSGTLSLESLVSLETFTVDFQEEGGNKPTKC